MPDEDEYRYSEEFYEQFDNINQKLDSIIDEDDNVKSKQSGSIVSTDENGDIVDENVREYRCLSSDTKPDASEVPLHSTLVEMDTSDVYYSDGTDWKVFE